MTRKQRYAGLTATQRQSIERSSMLCKEILGKEFRKVHEVMEGLHRKRPRKKPFMYNDNGCAIFLPCCDKKRNKARREA